MNAIVGRTRISGRPWKVRFRIIPHRLWRSAKGAEWNGGLAGRGLSAIGVSADYRPRWSRSQSSESGLRKIYSGSIGVLGTGRVLWASVFHIDDMSASILRPEAARALRLLESVVLPFRECAGFTSNQRTQPAEPAVAQRLYADVVGTLRRDLPSRKADDVILFVHATRYPAQVQKRLAKKGCCRRGRPTSPILFSPSSG
jgi:hypothetical protein